MNVAELAYTAHVKWVEANQRWFQAVLSAFGDDFWGRGWTDLHGQMTQEKYPIRMEVNRLRTWVNAHSDSVFYRGIHPSVGIDPLVQSEDPAADARMVEVTLETFAQRQNLSQLTDAAFQMDLMFGSFGIKAGVDLDVEHPLEAAYLELLPPWECVWDRNARRGRRPRYTGHLYWETKGNVHAAFDADKHGVDLEAIPGRGLPSDGEAASATEGEYVQVFVFYDLAADFEIEYRATSGVEKATVPGRMQVYVVDTASRPEAGTTSGLRLVHEGPLPFPEDSAGRPVSPIVQGVLSAAPHRPAEGHAEAKTIYKLQAEECMVMTFVANAARKDCNRTVLYNPEKAKAAVEVMTKGLDLAMAPVEGSLEGAVKVIDYPPMSSTLLHYYRQLGDARLATADVAPFTSGEPIRYVTATQTARLAEHTETSLGHMRLAMDRVVAAALELSLRAMSLGKAFSLTVDGVWTEVPRDLLRQPWVISVADAASTPMAEAQRRAEADVVLPKLIELAAAIGNPETPPIGKAIAQLQYTYLHDLYRLPRELALDHVLDTAAKYRDAEPEPEPEPTPEPAPEPAPAPSLPPGVAAIDNAVLAGGG